MLDGDCAPGNVNILHRNCQGLRDSASQSKKKPDKQAIADIGSRFLE